MRVREAAAVREFLLIFDKGEDLQPALLSFAKENRVAAASFYAIGALREGAIAYWNAATQVYEEIAVGEQVEVVSMTGNLAPSVEGTKMHAHVVLGKRDGSAVAGHFLRGIVFPTLEVFLAAREVRVERKKDPATGLWLLHF